MYSYPPRMGEIVTTRASEEEACRIFCWWDGDGLDGTEQRCLTGGAKNKAPRNMDGRVPGTDAGELGHGVCLY